MRAISPRAVSLCVTWALAGVVLAAWWGCAAGRAHAQTEPPLPQYELRVTLDRVAHTIAGSMVLRVDEAAGLPRDTWWFHLGPNRFLTPDPRGERRHLGYTEFGLVYVRRENRDLLLPDGFSPGGITITDVTDDAGRKLLFAVQPNATIPVGFNIADTLLEVHFHAESSGREIHIEFTTHLPHRYWDGWSSSGLFVEQWYPQLLLFERGDWVRREYRPSPGVYGLTVKSDQAGWVAAGTSPATQIAAEMWTRVVERSNPLRRLPLAFVPPLPARKASERGMTVTALFPEGGPQASLIAVDMALDLAVYMREQFGLDYPQPGLTLIAVDGPMLDMHTMGSIVLIPRALFQRGPLFNRVFVGRLAAAVAQVWFGETVWADRDTEGWMHLGLSGLISLDYFRELYGEDAGIHEYADWLRPRFREHYFESPVRNMMRAGSDVPIMVSLHEHPDGGAARVSVYEKAPLVLRSLNLVVGAGRYRQALGRFFEHNRYREVRLEDFQRELEAVAGERLDWFFDQFFRGTAQLDYGLDDWDAVPTGENGGVTVNIRLVRRAPGIMPVVVQITDAAGLVVAKRWDGRGDQKTLQVVLPGGLGQIVIDPDEYLLEIDRRNNYSGRQLRVRPFFDWSKQRENLITLKGWAGGNALDGNYVGIGAEINIDEDQQLTVIPALGEKSRRLLYNMSWRVGNFLVPRLTLNIPRTSVGGTEFQGLGLHYQFATPETFSFGIGAQANWEWVLNPIEFTLKEDGRERVIRGTNVNNLQFSQSLVMRPLTLYPTTWSLVFERSAPGLGSDFSYSKLQAGITQEIELGGDHLIELNISRAMTDGLTPPAKQFLLGDPLVLRGYPRLPELVHEQYAVLRAEYHLVVSRKIYGGMLQTRRWTLIFFGDVGKGWQNGENSNNVPQRQDLGIGLTIDVNGIGQVEVPVRFEVAYPVADKDYKNPQVIFFQALSFF